MAYAYYNNSAYKYGSSTRLYGTPSPAFTNRLWAIEIDWDNDGFYNGVNEGSYCIGLDIDRGFSDSFGEASAGYTDGFASPMVGRCTLQLDNSTGRYNLWTASGAPSSDILPNRKIRIRTKSGSAASTFDTIFTGRVVDISNNIENKTATIVAYDAVDELQNQVARVAPQTSAITSAEAINLTLQSIAWTDGYSAPASGNIPLFWSNDTAYKTITQAVKSAGVQVWFVDASGVVTMAPIQAVPSTDTNTTYTADYFLKPITISQPWDNLFVGYKVIENIIATKTATTVWSKDTTIDITVSGSSTTEFEINYTYNPSENYSYIVSSPSIASSDFVVNTSSDGSGTDITSSCTVSLQDYGTGATVRVVNTNALQGYLITTDITGTPKVFVPKETLTQITNWGTTTPKYYGIKSVYLQDNLGAAFGAAAARHLGYPHATKDVVVSMQNRNEQFTHDINASMLLNITIPYLAPLFWSTDFSLYYNNFRIRRIKHRWLSPNGQDYVTEWTLRHCIMQNVGTPFV